MHKELVYIKGFAKGKGMSETIKAVAIADSLHKGQKRKSGEDYIEHPMRVAKQLMSLKLYDDNLIAASLLHDVLEDCIVSTDSPFYKLSAKTIDIVKAVTKHPKDKATNYKTYYNTMQSSVEACLIKISDRCHNLSTMVNGFTREKIVSYIDETKADIFPLCKYVINTYPKYSDEVYAMRYHMESIIGCLEVCLKALDSQDNNSNKKIGDIYEQSV